jgi:hypothetical protein
MEFPLHEFFLDGGHPTKLAKVGVQWLNTGGGGFEHWTLVRLGNGSSQNEFFGLLCNM